MEKDLNTMKSALTLSQRVAICFAAGVIGAVAVVLFSHVLFRLGLSATLGVTAPVSLKSPDIYKPLFWGGLWGIPFGLFVKVAWNRLYLVGFLYVLAPLLALFLFGGAAVHSFVLALLIGIVSGTYSSICNASPLLVDWHLYDERRRRRELAKQAKPQARLA